MRLVAGQHWVPLADCLLGSPLAPDSAGWSATSGVARATPALVPAH